jgi:hypothetical protein
MGSLMRSGLRSVMLAILVAAVFGPAFVQAKDYAVGVKAGDWIKYGQITVTWTGNGTQPSYVTEMKEVDWIRMDVLSVTGTIVSLNETLHFDNGTQTVQPSGTDVQGSSGFFLVAANLTVGDPVSPQNPETAINQTVTRMYAGANRNVNMIDLIISSRSPQEEKIYYDKNTGIMVELYLNQTNPDNPGGYVGYVETSVQATETNLWSANPFDLLQNNLIYIVAGAALIILVLAAATVLRRRKSPSPQQPPPPPVSAPPPPQPSENRCARLPKTRQT